MSASDKKQQRKAAEADSLTQRERREQDEAKAAKQKKTVYTAVGVACAAAAVALLVWNNNGSFRKNAVAATVDGKEYSVSDLQYYYASARNQEYSYANYYAQFGYSFSTFDASIDDGAQWYDEEEGQTWADYFRDSALEMLKQTSALCSAAEEAGYTLSADGQKTIDDNLASIDKVCAQYGMTRSSYFKSQYGISEKVFLRNLTNDVLASEYAQYYKDNLTYDDAALQAYYEENADSLDSYDYRVFTVDGSVPTTDADGNTVEVTDEQKEEAMAAAKESADAALAAIQAASNKDSAFTAAAGQYASESSDASLQEGVLGSRLSSAAGSSLAQWLKDSGRKSGDATVIEGSSSYQVALFVDRYLVQDPTADVRHILIRPDTEGSTETNSKGTTVPTQEAMDAAKATAQSILDEFNNSDKTAERFGELANEYSEDTGSNTNGGLYTCVYEGEMVPNFNDWVFDPARKAGDTGLVENSGDDATYYGWHVIYYEGENVPYWKSTATSSLQSADQSEWVNGLVDAAVAEAADGMKYVGSTNTAQATPVESETPEASESPAA